jgi:hypothetical protein
MSRGWGASTTGSAEYYGEAEPELLAIRDRFLANEVEKDVATGQIGRLTGMARVDSDMQPLRAKKLRDTHLVLAFIAWQEKHPLACRLYGSPDVIAAAVLAPQEAVTVET